jgi:hypothetical protein
LESTLNHERRAMQGEFRNMEGWEGKTPGIKDDRPTAWTPFCFGKHTPVNGGIAVPSRTAVRRQVKPVPPPPTWLSAAAAAQSAGRKPDSMPPRVMAEAAPAKNRPLPSASHRWFAASPAAQNSVHMNHIKFKCRALLQQSQRHVRSSSFEGVGVGGWGGGGED